MKLSKSQAQYEPQAKNPRTICSNCTHFSQPDACDKVQGPVAPVAWCKFWKGTSALKPETTFNEFEHGKKSAMKKHLRGPMRHMEVKPHDNGVSVEAHFDRHPSAKGEMMYQSPMPSKKVFTSHQEFMDHMGQMAKKHFNFKKAGKMGDTAPEGTEVASGSPAAAAGETAGQSI